MWIPLSRITGKFLTDGLRPATGFPLKISTKNSSVAAIPGGIFLTAKGANTNLGPESYELNVSTNSIVIRAPAQAGLFYGVQTLLQIAATRNFLNQFGECCHLADSLRAD